MSGLRKHERCPIHGSLYCCGREVEKKMPRRQQYVNGVKKLPDGRELCTPAELKRRKDRLIKEQGGICAICGGFMEDYRDVELDHKEPRGMGGSFRNDAMSNLQATHALCNRAKGSQREGR